jgi:hypothetical protein
MKHSDYFCCVVTSAHEELLFIIMFIQNKGLERKHCVLRTQLSSEVRLLKEERVASYKAC